MVNERIVEAFQYIMSELFQFSLRQIQGFHQFVKHHLVDELADNRMLASIADDVHSRQICNRRQYGMRTVQQRNFSFMIRSFRRNEQYIQACLVCREFFCHFLRCLDYPQMENFSLNDHVVVVLKFFLNGINFLARESRNDTVYQGSIYTAGFFEPILEILAQVPQIDVLIYCFLQLMSVQENQFARENNQTF